MKKRVIITVLMFIVSLSVFAKSPEVPNGTVLKSYEENGHSIIVRKHSQSLTIYDPIYDYQMIIYNYPFLKEKIGELHEKDIIQIKEIYIIDNKEEWLKIISPKVKGYILFDKSEKIYDPYAKGMWQPVQTIKSGDKVWHTLKCIQHFLIYDNLNIRNKPGLSGEKIGFIKASWGNSASIMTSEVTVEKEEIDGYTERWAKITYKGIEGWVFGEYLEFERGGERFSTPESYFEMELESVP